MMEKKALVLFFLTLNCLLFPAVGMAVETLTLMTHDSFNVSREVLARFEQENRVKVRVFKAGDAGAALVQAILSKENPMADVFFGVDNTFFSRAVMADIFVPYNSPQLKNIPDQFIGKADIEMVRQRCQMIPARQYFYTRDNRHINPGGAAFIHKAEIFPVIKDHLGHDVIGPGGNLLFQITNVSLKVWSIFMFFGIAGNADTEIRPVGIQFILKKDALVHDLNLTDKRLAHMKSGLIR